MSFPFHCFDELADYPAWHVFDVHLFPDVIGRRVAPEVERCVVRDWFTPQVEAVVWLGDNEPVAHSCLHHVESLSVANGFSYGRN